MYVPCGFRPKNVQDFAILHVRIARIAQDIAELFGDHRSTRAALEGWRRNTACIKCITCQLTNFHVPQQWQPYHSNRNGRGVKIMLFCDNRTAAVRHLHIRTNQHFIDTVCQLNTVSWDCLKAVSRLKKSYEFRSKIGHIETGLQRNGCYTALRFRTFFFLAALRNRPIFVK